MASSPSSSPSSSSSSSSADLAGTGSLPEQAQTPSRRRLVKASMRAHLDDARKRDIGGAGSAPPGFAPPGFGGSVLADWGQSSNSPNPTSVTGSTPPLPVSTITGNVSSGFRDRDRGAIRSINKDFLGDYQAGLSHSTSKLGRPPHISNPAAMEARPSVRRVESLRRHDSCSQKHGEELKMQQAKRTALLRAQQAGATGSFRSFDSQFNNCLVPVIPMQFLSKVQSHSADMG